MTTVSYNLKTGDLFFDGSIVWQVLDTYPNSVRVSGGGAKERAFHYGEINGCSILESPEDYDAIDLSAITQEDAANLAQSREANDYFLCRLYNRIVEGWPSVSAYGHLAKNPATPSYILWSLLRMDMEMAALVAGNPKLVRLMATALARHESSFVRRSLARNSSVIATYPGVVDLLAIDKDETVAIALQATIDSMKA